MLEKYRLATEALNRHADGVSTRRAHLRRELGGNNGHSEPHSYIWWIIRGRQLDRLEARAKRGVRSSELNEHREYWVPIHTRMVAQAPAATTSFPHRAGTMSMFTTSGVACKMLAPQLKPSTQTCGNRTPCSRCSGRNSRHSTRRRTRLSRSWRWRHRYKRHLHCRRCRMTWQSHSQSTRRDTIPRQGTAPRTLSRRRTPRQRLSMKLRQCNARGSPVGTRETARPRSATVPQSGALLAQCSRAEPRAAHLARGTTGNRASTNTWS